MRYRVTRTFVAEGNWEAMQHFIRQSHYVLRPGQTGPISPRHNPGSQELVDFIVEYQDGERGGWVPVEDVVEWSQKVREESVVK